ncbi:Lsr2 family protein [Amycolatopsis sp. NPDC048633]|uniref:histone-like nucleoid-structuring protein Lsr2 n=1 Tax=Amycolatopsis sp. NPDC048633 TaxID=3157095 RepID=UPI0034093B34
MAQKVLVEILDDIDGSPATHTVPFSLDGVSYEIDLSDENAAALRTELDHYIAAARKTGGRKVRVATSPATPSNTVDRERNRAIRTWASENGYEIADRGRLSSEVIAAYERAQQQPSAPSRKRMPRKKVAVAKK